MATTVNTGWRDVTPGPCSICGMSDDYECDGRGTVYCSCQCCGSCGMFDGHEMGCPDDHSDCEDCAECGATPDDENATHWGYGSGMPGCLFDNGPHFAETQDAAIEAVLWYFSATGNETDLSETELEQARADLRETGTHYFPAERRGELGASLVQVWEEQGPCPEDDDA